MKKILRLSPEEAKRFRYNRLTGLAYDLTEDDSSENEFYAAIQRYQNNPVLFNELRSKQADIDKMNVFFRFFYYLFNINDYAKHAYMLEIIDSIVDVNKSANQDSIETPDDDKADENETFYPVNWVQKKIISLLPHIPFDINSVTFDNFKKDILDFKVKIDQPAIINPPRFDYNNILAHLEPFLTREHDNFNFFRQRHNPRPNARNGANINDPQSTHTASVHQSVSKFAKALLSRYEHLISTQTQFDKIINEMLSWFDSLESSDKTNIAKRCMQRFLEDEDSINFRDPVSQISIKQLLALSWVAIHDDALRLGDLKDAELAFIDGLSQIQREYNLPEDDVNSIDMPACSGGAFNKLVEKLVGIHPDVELIFMTYSTVAFKFGAIVKKALKDYLSYLPQPVEPDEVDERNALLDRLSNEKCDIDDDIWNQIKEAVSTQLFDEFSVLFNNSRENPAFIEMIDSGISYSLTKDDVLDFRPPGNQTQISRQRP